MADKKISQLNSASMVNTSDYLVLVQGSETMKIDVGTFLSKAPVPLVSQANNETVSSGALSKNILVSKISVPTSANVSYTLAAPVSADKGIEKIIVATTVTASYKATVTVSGGVGFSTIDFTAAGQSVHLREVDGNWFIIGSRGVTVN